MEYVCTLVQTNKKTLTPCIQNKGRERTDSRDTTLFHPPLTSADLIKFGQEMICRNSIAVTGDPGAA